MGRVTSRTTFSLQRRMFVSEGTLLIRVALNTGGVRTSSQSGLLEFKPAMRIMAITALHLSFENFMMRRLVEVSLCFTVATHAELRLTGFQHVKR